MEADILKGKKDLYLVQKSGGRYSAKVKRTDILSRCMEADMFDKRIGAYRYSLGSAHRHNCLFPLSWM